MKKIFTLICLLSVFLASAQTPVNGYAKVTAIVGPALTVSNASETYDQFNIGDKVIIMQMQDDVIGSNTSNNSNFGNLSVSGIKMTGKYEVATVLLVARTGILPTVITLTGLLKNTYNLGGNSSVQIITFPTLGNNFTTDNDISAVAWDGNRGGVVAFAVDNTLTLKHNIQANAVGFRGGVADVSSSPYGSCNSTDYYHATDAFYGNKGEGVYKVTNASFAAGKGKVLNGGGGGNTINAGGGGGGNYTTGGDGYFGWSCSLGTGGVAGMSLLSQISGERFFMGGGGGSGEANDNNNNKGGNGGGIVIIKAKTIRTNGSGSTLSISANGQNANDVSNDGGGGGGAGGSVVLLVESWNISHNKKLIISANGGNGGNVGTTDQHGGGGGGGQGAVIYSSPIPTTNITTNTTNGIGGLIKTGGSRAASGQGASNAGILASAVNILPLQLTSFTAIKNNEHTQLEWKTQNEVNVSHFEIERSVNGTAFETIGNVQAAGNAVTTQTYAFADPKAVTVTTYYRLKMVDVDNKFTYSNVLVIRASNAAGIGLNVFPNPAVSQAALYIKSDVNGTATVRILNMQGASIFVQRNLVSKGENTVLLNRINELSSGVYSIQVTLNDSNQFTRLVIQK